MAKIKHGYDKKSDLFTLLASIQDCCFITKLCLTFCNTVDCSPPGSSVHGCPRQEHCSGLPFPPPGDLPHPGIKPLPPALAGGFFTAHWATTEAHSILYWPQIHLSQTSVSKEGPGNKELAKPTPKTVKTQQDLLSVDKEPFYQHKACRHSTWPSHSFLLCGRCWNHREKPGRASAQKEVGAQRTSDHTASPVTDKHQWGISPTRAGDPEVAQAEDAVNIILKTASDASPIRLHNSI